MSILLTREELYEMVWEQPVTKVAAELEISDVALWQRYAEILGACSRNPKAVHFSGGTNKHQRDRSGNG